MILTQILRPECLKVPLDSKNKENAIEELVNLLDENGLLLNKNTTLDAVMKRENTRSTGIGSGIAIPHAKCDAVKELTMAVGLAKDTIDFQSVDAKPVKIIILLVSPDNQTGPHIQALAKISQLMLDNEFKEKLENANSAEDAYELLRKRENE